MPTHERPASRAACPITSGRFRHVVALTSDAAKLRSLTGTPPVAKIPPCCQTLSRPQSVETEPCEFTETPIFSNDGGCDTEKGSLWGQDSSSLEGGTGVLLWAVSGKTTCTRAYKEHKPSKTQTRAQVQGTQLIGPSGSIRGHTGAPISPRGRFVEARSTGIFQYIA